MNVCFLTPHTRVSGGVKVIFRLANRLQRMGCNVTVLIEKYNDKNMFWFGEKIGFKLEKFERNSIELNKPDIVINYGDGRTDLPLPPNVKHVLLLQNFGIHNVNIETKNLSYPFDGVIVVSEWLSAVAKRIGHKKIFVVHPGIDPIFQPKKEPKSSIPVIGTLYHTLELKNFNFFIAMMKILVYKYKVVAKAVLLSAYGIAPIVELDSYSIANSIICNPPQFYLPFMYSTCAAWISPSNCEGFGLTTVEAMACGCPTVTVRNKGLDNYLVDEHNCMLVSRPEDAASATLALLRNEQLRIKVIRGGIQLAKRFSWKESAVQFHEALRKIISCA
jgi:glycosyltransferase involved in cell wall biosynthesis